MDPNNPNNPYFNPFMNCYRTQLDPNNPNPNQFLTFSNWYPQPSFFNQNSPVGDKVFENQPNPDVDVVPETQPDAQPASSRRRHRRKEVSGKTTKPTIIKWTESEELQTSKRTKTSSSGKYTTTQSDSTGRCFVNLNESDEEVEMDMPPPTSPQRPPGRNNKGKRPQASSSIDYKDTLETISDSLQKFVNIQEQKQYKNDMKLLCTPIDHSTGRACEIAEKSKEQIMKKYNL
ncbi:hypothetical protein R6Q57_021023 [Mikania cordata]